MPTSPVKLSIFFSHLDHILEGNNARLLDVARMAEDEGADQAVFSEHITLAQKIEGVGEAAKFPFEPTENYPEPFVALAAIAGATKTLRLATGILIAPLRPATVLAKLAATLDHVSGSRFDLGVGSGWHIPELEAVGVDPSQALEVMEDTVRACRALWSGEPATYHSRHVNFDTLYCRPAPFARAKFPVWLAGPPTAKGADRVARLGQGWLPFGNLTAQDVKRGAEYLRAAEAKYGHSPGLLGIRAALPTTPKPDMEAMLDAAFAVAPDLVAAGATHLQLPLWRYVRKMGDVAPVIRGARQRLDAACRA